MRTTFQTRFIRSAGCVFALAALAACAKEVTVGEGGAAVAGIVYCEECVALPADTEVRVLLEDISRADAPAVLISEQLIRAEGRQSPFDFVVPYDPKKIDDRHTYAVRAEVRYGGALRFISTTVYPVITRGAGARVDVLVQSAATPASSPQNP